MYDPIYSQNIGLCGFRCRVVNKDGTSCTRVVRSYKGIVMHCLRVHGLRAQMELPYGKETSQAVVEPVRADGNTEHFVSIRGKDIFSSSAKDSKPLSKMRRQERTV